MKSSLSIPCSLRVWSSSRSCLAIKSSHQQLIHRALQLTTCSCGLSTSEPGVRLGKGALAARRQSGGPAITQAIPLYHLKGILLKMLGGCCSVVVGLIEGCLLLFGGLPTLDWGWKMMSICCVCCDLSAGHLRVHRAVVPLMCWNAVALTRSLSSSHKPLMCPSGAHRSLMSP